jgi:hypothetical protein
VNENDMKIQVNIPQITFETIDFEVSEDFLEKDITTQCEEIYNNLTDTERNWVPMGLKGLLSAIDTGYTKIKAITP